MPPGIFFAILRSPPTTELPRMIKILTYLTLGLLSGITWASDFTPKIEIKGEFYRASELCFEQGYVRSKYSDTFKRAFTAERLILENGKIFTRYELIPAKFHYYNPILKTYVDYEIEECQSTTIQDKDAKSSQWNTRPANPAEALFYGNLLNHSIENSILEKWPSNKQNINQYEASELETARIEFQSVENPQIESNQWQKYEAWLDQTSQLIGGEQSGGGSGRVFVNLRMSASDLRRVRVESSKFENLLGLKSLYKRVIEDEEKLPFSKVSIRRERE